MSAHFSFFKKSYRLFVGASIFVFSLLSVPVLAVTTDTKANTTTPHVFLVSSSPSIAPNAEFTIQVLVDSPLPINALDLQISYPSDKIQFLNSDTAQSVVSFWQSPSPFLFAGHLRFTGGMAMPFQGTKGIVSTLHFRSLGEGYGIVSFERNNIYLADGKGTKISALASSYQFTIDSKVKNLENAVPAPVINDSTNPSLNVQTVIDPASGAMLVIYVANDAESGIRTVEMRSKNIFSWSKWQAVRSPILYPKNARSVEFRATNGVGLQTVAAIQSINIFLKLCITISVLCIIFLFVLVYNKSRRTPKV